jgi:hypothetical protein
MPGLCSGVPTLGIDTVTIGSIVRDWGSGILLDWTDGLVCWLFHLEGGKGERVGRR